MIRRLSGTVVEKLRQQIIIDVGGVGYDVFVPPALLTSVAIGSPITLCVSESVREDGHDLYGFVSAQDRASFELLRKVSGVGPKAALGVCGFFPAEVFSRLVAAGDSAKLSLVPGIGRKTAEKIILDLAGKLDTTVTGQSDDVVDALRALGYSGGEIAKLVVNIPANLTTVSEKVTWVLRNLAS